MQSYLNHNAFTNGKIERGIYANINIICELQYLAYFHILRIRMEKAMNSMKFYSM